MKLALISLGCPKNQVDADVMCHGLISAGHTTTNDLNQADVIFINTCGFIESAKAEAIEHILDACSYKEQNPNLKVVVTGCLAQRYKEEIRKEIPEVDAVVGIGSNNAMPSILERLYGTAPDQNREYYGPRTDLPLGGKRVISTPGHFAYLKISEGCNHGCYYCAIPLIRGPLRSRSIQDCVAEARWLAGEGVQELVLVAQDPTSYGDDWGENSICKLLDELNKVEGLRWIRLLYAYPERITDELIAAMVRNEKVVHYLDLPIQHCNSRILKAMNRKGDRQVVESAIQRLRAAMPDITLRTTLIAGYPGETEEEFEELCQFVKDTGFERLGCFAYSPEEDTVAAKMPDQIDEEEKRRRADIIMQTQANISAAKLEQKVGKTLTVICDGVDEESGLYLCRSAADAPEIDGNVCVSSEEPLYPGHFYSVKIEESDMYDLYGYVVEEDEDESAE
ncbi:MAG: 30S ribosomal protein S12 methylthiotransferase RimO [Candidatus Fournierella pullistercoris]|uniref:Ribosomal protein uS12 methylthiotransferase RimO n=1 Tax=Candidatus Allofournierella pullistercoris TaxID=2838597 RepID=A0A948T1H4_9FIRM|nr:30S ribosomal protein S12 methylthiotransferase RimO [Candidatus Fournierella pullistercoris]